MLWNVQEAYGGRQKLWDVAGGFVDLGKDSIATKRMREGSHNLSSTWDNIIEQWKGVLLINLFFFKDNSVPGNWDKDQLHGSIVTTTLNYLC